jgi:putative lipoprotein
MAEQRIAIAGQVPIEFRLDYDAVQINPKHTYTVAARIVSGDKLLFVSDTPNHVITQGSPGHLELVLKKPAPAKQ